MDPDLDSTEMDKTDVGDWLAGLGFGRYAQIFAENAIGADVLSDLSETDLEKLDIPLGDRKRLLKAIAARAENHTTAPAVTAPGQAERRQLSVMFTDLVGSTALSARLDPEDLREVIGAYHRCVAETVSKFGGFVAKYMGDGVLVYFGYPQAHENDAERAVRAGLALIEAVDTLGNAATQELQVRIGIGTGPVIVGDLIGRGEAQERGVVGESPNLAARLQAIAEPNSVVIAASTRQLVGDLFEYHDLGAIAAKGFSEPLPAFEVLGESGVESRFEAFHSSALTPMVGREEEIELLLRRWARAKEGEGQVVLLSGEPGIGKSRIAATMLERLQGEPHSRLRYFCSPHHQASALHPFINQLERAVGFERDDTPDRKLDRLEALLARASPNARDAAVLADLLSIPSGNRYQLPDLSPQKRKEETLTTFLAQLEGLAARSPVLLIFEDAHWIDPTSLELLERIIDRIQSLPVLLIVTARPEFTPPRTGHPQVTVHPLNRLTRREGVVVIERLAGGRSLPKEIVDQIVARTDGVPLFIEELTKAILESEVLRSERDRYVLTGSLPPLSIPTTLHGSLMARLDRLAPVRKIAEIGAAIGREFSHELIAAIAELPEGELDDALGQLVAAELVYRRGTPPDAVYTFKHALVQEAAYSTLLRGARQQLHARIATVLPARFPEVAATQPELLAHHCAEGGLADAAIDYWFAAGERALHTSANVEAIRHLSQGLQLLSSLRETPERRWKELRFQTTLGPALLATRGWASSEAEQAYSRAEELCQNLRDHNEHFKIVSGLWLIHMTRGESSRARALSDELFRLAKQQNDDDLRIQAHHSAWAGFQWCGEFAAVRDHAELGISLYSPAKHAAHALTYAGHDPGVCAWIQGGLALWFLGYPDRALANARRAMTLAEQIAHPPTIAHALSHGVILHQLRRDPATVSAWGEQLVRLAGAHRLEMYEAVGTFARGWAMANQDQAKAGLVELRRGMDACVGLGMRLFQPYHQAVVAEAYLRAGEIQIGLDVVEEAMRFVTESGVRFWEAELWRLKGTLLSHLAPGETRDVEACYREALRVARHQQAKSLELRAAMSLARFWRDQGRRDEARDLLAAVYGSFTEGFETPDLRDAKALLDELS
jgi:class 3 adenylate cyclase/predicted ATPase